MMSIRGAIRSFSLLGASLLVAGSVQAATLVVANKAEATVSLVDLRSGKVAATLPVGVGPHEVAISPDGRLALVANYGEKEPPGSTMTLIDIPGAKVVRTIDLGEYRRPHGAVFLDGRRALVTSETSKAVLEVDVEAGKVVRQIPTGQEISHMVAVSPDRSRAYVANIVSGSTTALDLKEGKAVVTVKTGAGTEGIDVTPDGRQVWITNREDAVKVVDAKSLEVIATIPVATFPIRAKVTPNGKRVLVSAVQSGDLVVLSAKERKVEKRINLSEDGPAPVGVIIAPDGKRAWVAHAEGGAVSVVDLQAGKRTGALAVGKGPDGMGYSGVDVAARP
jgi:YVTN family beta-propeller protein